MVDIVQTPANVIHVSGGGIEDLLAGETLVAGDACYKKTSDSRAWKADANDTAAKAVLRGIALGGAAAGQPVRLAKSGDLNPGGTVVVGEIYLVSSNVGKFAPEAEITSGMYVTVIGVGETASNIKLGIKVSGITIP